MRKAIASAYFDLAVLVEKTKAGACRGGVCRLATGKKEEEDYRPEGRERMGTCCSSTYGYAALGDLGADGHLGVEEARVALETRAKRAWAAATTGHTSKMTGHEAKELMRELAPWVPNVEARNTLREVDDVAKVANAQFVKLFVRLALSVPRTHEIFEAAFMATESNLGLSERELGELLGGEENLKEREDLIARFGARGRIGKEGLRDLLSDTEVNSIGDPNKLNIVYQSMNRPLCDYFISSSHNSSLVGNQWNSKSSGEAIKRALLLGVRVIELDAWENEEGMPIITHGHTLTVPTSFRECIEVIKEVGFVTSEYPVIVTIENHCGIDAQRKQVEILHSVLGNQLWGHDRDVSRKSLRSLVAGPDDWMSPNELRKMVIVRDKPIKKRKPKDTKRARRASALVERHRRRSVNNTLDDMLLQEFGRSQSMSDYEEIEDGGYEDGGYEDDDDEEEEQGEVSSQHQQQQPTPMIPIETKPTVEQMDLNDGNNGVDDEDESLKRLSAIRIAKRISARLGTAFILASTASGRRSIGSRNDESSSDDDEELEGLDEKKIEELNRFAETVNFGAADRDLLQLMYIKNVKLKYRLMPNGSGTVFEEPAFKSSSSINERKLAQLVRTPQRRADLAAYTKNHIIRVYPSNQRVDSSNFDPILAWNAGVQLVALNMQKNGTAVWLAQGKFSDNGGCGFVLKDQDANVKPHKLRITVISGHYLFPNADSFELDPQEEGGIVQQPPDVFVEVSIHGAPEDRETFRTRPVRKNGFNPRWNQECVFQVSKPELAHLLFTVKTSEDQLLGQYAIKETASRQGFRVVPLKSAASVKLKFSKIFCKVVKEQ